MTTAETTPSPSSPVRPFSARGVLRPSLLPLQWFVEIAMRERTFLVILCIALALAGSFYGQPEIARWLGFVFASYAVVGNDSIQTIGTFIASNPKSRWWVLWLYIGGIFLATVAYSFVAYGGDVSFQRLATKGFTTAPMEFSFLQVAAPLVLLVLTRLRMPVSTSILLLTSFATQPEGVGGILAKSVAGYAAAFGVSLVLWLVGARLMERWFRGQPHPGWRIAQWITSGFLWSVWIMQDAANVAVYLPRQLSWVEFGVFSGVIIVGLGVLFYFRGERIQAVVDEKSDVVDVRPATIIDLVYSVIIYVFKEVNQIPMSTTWVFIGLLGGRELAMAWRRTTPRSPGEAFSLLMRDVGYATVGLVISISIAVAVNESIRTRIMQLIATMAW